MRRSGILFPVFSLPSRYGIGCFSREAREFVDFLKEAGQTCWQILPLGPTGFGDSPYQPFSAFAGNPYFIDPESLISDGFLTEQEAGSFDFGHNIERVDYGALYNNRSRLLRTAYERAEAKGLFESREYQDFCREHSFWLEDYAIFSALKKKYSGTSWLDWDREDRIRDPEAMRLAREEYKDTIRFYCFMQFMFQKQWMQLKAYANENGIEIIGDIPFYVAMDSADAWSHPEAFCFDEDGLPALVAGCPPDAFSPTGQLWGNPVYDWESRKKDGYSWWISRFARNRELFDIIRIDHFHGFAEYYAIPYGDKTAEKGIRQKGPGMDLFRTVKEKLPGIRIIAEDLGTNTPETEKLLRDSGFPGMNVLQYAFDWSESSWYLTYNHKKNSVVYTGNHDNPTTRAWIESCSDHDRDFARRFIHSENTDYGGFVWDMIREAYRSTADLCVIPLQDYLVKGNEARINEPGTSQGNWQWRLVPNFLSRELAASIRDLTVLYGRQGKKK